MRAALQRLVAHLALYGAGNAIARLLTFLLVPLLTRAFSPAEYGVVEVVGVTLALLSSACILGLDTALFRFAQDPRWAPAVRRSLVSTLFWARAIPPVAVAVAGALLAPLLSRVLWGTGAFTHLLRIAFLTLPPALLLNQNLDLLRLAGAPGRYGAVMVGASLGRLLLSIYWVVLRGTGVVGVFYADLVASLLLGAVSLWMIRREIGGAFSAPWLRRALRFSLPLAGSAVLLWGLYTVDRYLLTAWGLLSEVGLYALGKKIAGLLTFLLGTFQVAWSPLAYSLQGDPRSGEFYERVLTLFVVGASALASALALFAPEIILLISGATYLDAAGIVGPCALTVVLDGALFILTLGSTLADRSRHVLAALAAGLSVNVIVNALAIPRWGMAGAAWAGALSFLVAIAVLRGLGRSYATFPRSFALPAAGLSGAFLATVLAGPVRALPGPVDWGARFALLALFPLLLLRCRHRRLGSSTPPWRQE